VRVLLTGAAGQLGTLLVGSAPPELQLTPLDRSQLDVSRPTAVATTVAELRPELIVNAAAYTDVDGAEREPEEAFATNAEGAASLARAARACGARLIHVSTDFVFDGRSGRPYRPSDPPAPLGVYGRSKLAGERRVLEELPGNAVVLRTAWLYSRHGSNFVKTMLGLMAHRERLEVVVDQVGSPTWAAELARTIWAVAATPELAGVHHWTDAGLASRYDLAMAVLKEGIDAGLLSRALPIVPIRTEDLRPAAPRPAFAVLDSNDTCKALRRNPRHWRRALRAMLLELRDSADG
jgi:dTDP-4-dehydrorhamnose reductase